MLIIDFLYYENEMEISQDRRKCRCLPDYPENTSDGNYQVLPSYETLMIHLGAIACVGQNSLHLKQATHNWTFMGSALWFTI
jgi:hypothetical protein